MNSTRVLFYFVSLIEASQGEYNYLIAIYGHEFFKWLDIPNPYKKINRLFKN